MQDTRHHDRITGTDILVGVLTVIGFIGASFCLLESLGSF